MEPGVEVIVHFRCSSGPPPSLPPIIKEERKPTGWVHLKWEDQCSICLDTLEYIFKDNPEFTEEDVVRKITAMPCGHVFHKNCIVEWFIVGRFSCPVCRWEPPVHYRL